MCKFDSKTLTWSGTVGRLVGRTVSSSSSDYVVQAVLGSGGFGAVLQCHKKLTNETVALKVIRDTIFIKYAKQEVGILEFLRDAGAKDFNIVTLKNTFTFNGLYCLEFEKLDIGLNYYVDETSLSLKEIRPLLYQLARALTFLASRDIVHADVKPSNILMVDHLRQPLKVKLIDFGSALMSSEEMIGDICSSVWYIAPEVLLGAPYNHHVDMWALGCVAAEMLMGCQLFPGKCVYDIIRRIIKTIGMPPDYMLNTGCYANLYFTEKSTSQQSRTWTLKSPNEIQHEDWSPYRKRTLNDLLKVSPGTAEVDGIALECDRTAFVDLVTKMLHIDPAQRIMPADVLEHPFLTLIHLDRDLHHNYVKLSCEFMEVCDMWSLKEKELPRSSVNTGRSSSSSSSSSSNESGTSYATGRAKKKRNRKKRTVFSPLFLFFVVWLMVALTKFGVLAEFLTNCRSLLLFLEKNMSELDLDSSLTRLEFLLNPSIFGLTANLHPIEWKWKRVKLTSLPPGVEPTLQNWFLNTVKYFIIKMDETRVTTDHYVTMLAETWHKNDNLKASLAFASTILVVFIVCMRYQSNLSNVQTI